jgi:hypothetical protein
MWILGTVLVKHALMGVIAVILQNLPGVWTVGLVNGKARVRYFSLFDRIFG